MNCPYCNFHFNVGFANSTQEEAAKADLVPVLCEDCGMVSLIENGKHRKITVAEFALIKQSPVWKEFLEPVYNLIMKNLEKERKKQ